MKNRKVKQMVCDVHNKKYKDKCYFNDGVFGRMNYSFDPSVTEMYFGKVLFRMARSLTADQLKEVK